MGQDMLLSGTIIVYGDLPHTWYRVVEHSLRWDHPSFQHWSVNQSRNGKHLRGMFCGSHSSGCQSYVHFLYDMQSPCQLSVSQSVSQWVRQLVTQPSSYGQGRVSGLYFASKESHTQLPFYSVTSQGMMKKKKTHISLLRWWSHSSNNHNHHLQQCNHQRRTQSGCASAQKKREEWLLQSRAKVVNLHS